MPTMAFFNGLVTGRRSQVAKAADCKSAIVGSTPTGASFVHARIGSHNLPCRFYLWLGRCLLIRHLDRFVKARIRTEMHAFAS